jgi:hypothetical protein
MRSVENETKSKNGRFLKIIIFTVAVAVFLVGVFTYQRYRLRAEKYAEARKDLVRITRALSRRSDLGRRRGLQQGETRKRREKGRKSSDLNEKEKSTLKNWLLKDRSRSGAHKVGAICLNHRLSKTVIIDLIGKPGRKVGANRIFYIFGPSQFLMMEFDDKGLVIIAEVTG